MRRKSRNVLEGETVIQSGEDGMPESELRLALLDDEPRWRCALGEALSTLEYACHEYVIACSFSRSPARSRRRASQA
ncbi:hypothetical protein C8E00_10840 [Chromohalobacter marismortui]|uniref:Uncharacterized protein n=2 Tax=Chromohalobacter TaxID=42054 RepID=A0A4R7NFV2_9GAMM|nr:hypothetical protein C8E00_10840 [Chromohalobacter marismortui]